MLTIFVILKKKTMKKILILLIITSPLFSMAQVNGAATKPVAENAVTYDNNTHVYAEVVVAYVQGKGNARIELSDSMKDIVTDKENMMKIENLKTARYANGVDALNAMNSQGFQLVSTYTIEARNGIEVHMVMEKSLRGNPAGRPGPAAKQPQRPSK